MNKSSKPYAVRFVCGEVKATQSFTVLPPKAAVAAPAKQVSKVPGGGAADGWHGRSRRRLVVRARAGRGCDGVLAAGGARAVLVRRRVRG
ncbi:hypothetical protein [Amycolatopsis sp. FDAARGOS 1241]|uniref:hypothetical protein n=1 Tax=Amycolatopsis sp. FDAARGOS 1241 TaxID=2778070 RepID=UPI00194E9638|nr:hypothetical protein [Amycolatopsis sp. FDAARGOS 1241]QRP45184.1 hypothetical protein I6J71_39410 [Amycolatopsis sp. FDAARGOS 1241]